MCKKAYLVVCANWSSVGLAQVEVVVEVVVEVLVVEVVAVVVVEVLVEVLLLLLSPLAVFRFETRAFRSASPRFLCGYVDVRICKQLVCVDPLATSAPINVACLFE